MKMNRWNAGWVILMLAGCDPVPAAAPAPVEPVVELATQYDAQRTGSIAGQVVWAGAIPAVEPFAVHPLSLYHDMRPVKELRANPNAPVIDPKEGGVGNAVVFLRNVVPAASRSWDLAPVQVAIEDYRFDVRQGDRVGRYGLVRRGATVEFVSRQRVHQMVRASGATFFNLAFPEPDSPRMRVLSRSGVVELSNSINFFWMRGYLFVADHPYYTCTDARGRFVLRDVPPGQYELVCWMPSWRESSRDFDPEFGLVLRLHFEPPVERTQTVSVESGHSRNVRFEMKLADFVATPPSAGHP